MEAIRLHGLNVDVDLAELPEKEEEVEDPAKEPVDLEKLLADIRQRVSPIEIQLEDIAAKVRRGDEVLFEMEQRGIEH